MKTNVKVVFEYCGLLVLTYLLLKAAFFGIRSSDALREIDREPYYYFIMGTCLGVAITAIYYWVVIPSKE